jgi:hypothetical protein
VYGRRGRSVDQNRLRAWISRDQKGDQFILGVMALVKEIYGRSAKYLGSSFIRFGVKMLIPGLN